MKTRDTLIISLIVLAATVFVTPLAQAIEGYPGSSWGELRQDFPLNNNDVSNNLFLQGWVEQGIDWKRWGNFYLNTYATLRYKWDSRALDYNNSIGPGAGIGISYLSPKGDNIKLGCEYIYDQYFKNGDTDQKVVLYLRWFTYWNLKK
ncbi:MAG: hypothetical protein AB9919_10615 [Geobacteraceae bacterium]